MAKNRKNRKLMETRQILITTYVFATYAKIANCATNRKKRFKKLKRRVQVPTSELPFCLKFPIIRKIVNADHEDKKTNPSLLDSVKSNRLQISINYNVNSLYKFSMKEAPYVLRTKNWEISSVGNNIEL